MCHHISRTLQWPGSHTWMLHIGQSSQSAALLTTLWNCQQLSTAAAQGLSLCAELLQKKGYLCHPAFPMILLHPHFRKSSEISHKCKAHDCTLAKREARKHSLLFFSLPWQRRYTICEVWQYREMVQKALERYEL